MFLPDYSRLFNQMSIRAVKRGVVDSIVNRMVAHKEQYQEIAQATGLEWYVIAALHYRESDMNFGTHLHNGDPLTARTVHVPAGRPVQGKPPFKFVPSAIDALTDRSRPSDNQIGTLLDWMEEYNGTGYRRKNMNSPYVWSFSNQYGSGKYVADSKFDKDAVDEQCGVAPILLRMHERGIIVLEGGEPIKVTIGGKATEIEGRLLRGNSSVQARGVTEALGGVIQSVNINTDPILVTVGKAKAVQTFPGYMIGTSSFVDASELAKFLGRSLRYDPASRTLVTA